MPLNRNAYLARTAHDLSHVNKLHIPAYGVAKLYLEIGAASSKTYLIEQAPAPKQAKGASDDFHFAPEKEKPTIKYTIDDVGGHITKATLELLHRNSKAAIWKKDLKDDEFTHGDHEFEWDGKIDKGTDFPEEYITVEHSPYKLKLTVEGAADAVKTSPAAWTYLQVLVHSIELEKGVKEAVTRDLDKALFDETSVPDKKKGKQEVCLISNLFSLNNADKNDDSSYTLHRDLWKSGAEEGPCIPVFAKLHVKSSKDEKEEVPKAIGRVRLLWDWRDDPEQTGHLFGKAKEFVKPALDYDKKATRPNGDNCHMDRGGKRGDDSKPVFAVRPGYAEAPALTADSFPFKVISGTKRKFSAYSETWRSGKLMGKTGVLFQPSAMAGDAYLIDAYFPHKRNADGTDELDELKDEDLKHAIKESTGVWQIWREVHVSLYLKKDASLPNLSFPAIAKSLADAYIKLEDKSGGAQAPMAGYDGFIRGHLAALTPHQLAVVKPGDQGTLTKGGIMFRSRSDWKTELKRTQGWTDVQVNSWLTANNVATNTGFDAFLEAIADNVVVKTCNDYFTASDGVKVFHLEPYWEADGGMKSSTGGFASVSFASLTRQKAGYIHGVLTPPPSINEIAAHELGHTLFLPHAPGTARGPAAPHDETSHWNNCMMSYHFNREMKFCGLCLLRMRGWKWAAGVLSSSRNANKR